MVLTWNETPRISNYSDLDSYLVAPGCTVSYRRLKCTGSSYTADLDVDDTSYGGPEVITLQETMGATGASYTYAVHAFSGL